MAYQNVWEENGLLRVFTDTTSCEEVLAANVLLYSDPHFDTAKYLINDFTRVLSFETSPKSINECLAIDKAASRSKNALKVAMVATIESLLTCAYIYTLKMEETSFQCEVFDNINDANRWIHGTDFVPQTIHPIEMTAKLSKHD